MSSAYGSRTGQSSPQRSGSRVWSYGSWLLYGFFAAVTLVEEKPRLEQGIDGSWLLATVATEAVAVLAFIAWALTAFGLVQQLRAHDAKSVSEV